MFHAVPTKLVIQPVDESLLHLALQERHRPLHLGIRVVQSKKSKESRETKDRHYTPPHLDGSGKPPVFKQGVRV